MFLTTNMADSFECLMRTAVGHLSVSFIAMPTEAEDIGIPLCILPPLYHQDLLSISSMTVEEWEMDNWGMHCDQSYYSEEEWAMDQLQAHCDSVAYGD